MNFGNAEAIAQFTEDAHASEPIPCGRSSCSTILQPGDSKHYITGGTRGKFVCNRCFEYYAKKPDTLLRPDVASRLSSTNRQPLTDSIISPAIADQLSSEMVGSNLPASHSSTVDVQSIRASVNQAQRKDSSFLAQKVTHLPNSLPSAVLQRWTRTPASSSQLPAVGIPSSWSSNGGSYSLSQQLTASGYSGSHSLYKAEHDNIIVQAVREISGKTRPELISNLQEGHQNIPASTTPRDLIKLVENTMLPQLRKAMNWFPFQTKSLTIRELCNWTDLSRMPQDQPYFYHRCLGLGRGKDKKNVFKIPSKPFTLGLIVPAYLWEESLDYIATQEEAELQNKSEDIGISDQFESMVTVNSGENLDSHSSRSANSAIAVRTPQKPNTQGSADLSPTSAPSKKRVHVSIPYTSPDRMKIREALKAGGLSVNLQANSSFLLMNPCPGTLTINHLESIGIGACKTAHKGLLTLTPIAEAGLGDTLNQHVAVKRVYYADDRKSTRNSSSQTGLSIGRFAIDSERQRC
ncbi:hypothetical protein BDQ17DRAFT_1433524 [Cyathus striatus]|nr:hypothetical protein BDQ17DRAFT_1433524 [Cyathus striatus]